MTTTLCRDPRAALGAVERVVVKVGSALITERGRLAPAALARLARDVAALRERGYEVIMVVSGAVAAGYQAMGLTAPPTEIVARQAAASVGQHRLIAAASSCFAAHGMEVAQLLLSAEDVENRRRFLSARHTLRALLERGVIPIVNENDALADDESKVGDNDHLAALVASLASAELLVILSNVAGVRRDAGDGPVVSYADDADALHAHVHTGTSATGVGGMAAKISAARLAGATGVATIIADGRASGLLDRIVDGDDVGTLIPPPGSIGAARTEWITIRRRSRGRIMLTRDAASAVAAGRTDVRPCGVTDVEGTFSMGARVEICDPSRRTIAAGLVSYSSHEIRCMRGQDASRFTSVLGYRYVDAIVLREDLVIR